MVHKFFALMAAAAVAMPASAAVNLVSNGGFEITSKPGNFEFGASFPSNLTAVTDWSSPGKKAYNLLFDSATAFTPAGNAQGRFSYTGKEYLWTGVASPDGGNFVALDGETVARGPLEQLISSLKVGNNYQLTFYWAAAQVASRTGPTTEQLQVSFGGTPVFSTPVVNNPSQGFSGWFFSSTIFKATSTAEVLSFLSVGTPDGLPPIALLDGVSLIDRGGGNITVPEAGTWAMMIAGFGLVGAAARRRMARLRPSAA